MNSLMDPSGVRAQGLSRRQVLSRVAGGLAGSLFAVLGLPAEKGHAQAGGIVSLRAVMRQIAPDCDPAHGIRLMLPDVGPVTSLQEIIRRFYRG